MNTMSDGSIEEGTQNGTMSGVMKDPDTASQMEVDETWPSNYRSAGVIPFNKDGYSLGKFEKGYADFGGKKGGTDANPWETARRELEEECGIKASSYHSWTFHPESKSKHVLFFVETSDQAKVKEPDKVKEVRFITWKERAESGLPSDLHPRMRYDKGNLIRNTLKDIAKKYVGGRKRASVRDGKVEANEGDSEVVAKQAKVQVDTKHVVSEESRPVVLKLREDVDMRAAYYLSTLTYEEYIGLNPRRKAKCEKKGRDVRAEFQQLQGYLKQILGKENVMRGYSYAGGKGSHKVGRLFSIGYGLQGVWSEVRGILARQMTDADMSNCHPRILSWICDENEIEADELKSFIADREAVYTDIITSKWTRSGPVPKSFLEEERGNAKDTVLAMMNDESPFPGIEKLPERVQKLDATFKRLQKAVCSLPKYAHLEKLSRTHKVKTRYDGTTYSKHNKLGSWLNLILCDHEKTFTNDASSYLKEKHGFETGELAFDGLMFYGNHYAKESEVCGGLKELLMEKHKIHMPWTFKPHSTVIQMPDDFQVYDIPQRSYVQNISDDFLRSEEDFSRMISGLRGEYESVGSDKKGAYRAAAESLTIRSKRPLDVFASYWDRPVLNLNAEVLKYYARESNEKQHIFNVKSELNILGNTSFSEAELRDYFVQVWGAKRRITATRVQTT